MKRYNIRWNPKLKRQIYQKSGRIVPRGIVRHEYRRRQKLGVMRQRFALMRWSGHYIEEVGAVVMHVYEFGDFVAKFNMRRAMTVTDDWLKRNLPKDQEPLDYKIGAEIFDVDCRQSKLSGAVALFTFKLEGRKIVGMDYAVVGGVSW